MLCLGKTPPQIAEAIALAQARGLPLLLTRLEPEGVRRLAPAEQAALDYDPPSRTAVLGAVRPAEGEPRVAVVTAGTSDLPVAREALRTLAFYGVARARDRGRRRRRAVAHAAARAGASALSGRDRGRRHGGRVVQRGRRPGRRGRDRGPDLDRLRRRAQGETALHAALASCAPGLVTVNIDNGYGAACAAIRALGGACPHRDQRVAPRSRSKTPRSPTPVDLWIPITIGAAFFQNLRSALQKHLKGRLSNTGATFSRFAYAAPLAVAYVDGSGAATGDELPQPERRPSLVYAVAGGLAQITATALLLYSFSFRNFAVGTTYSKTETVQTAIFGILILGDPLGIGAALAIVISLLGVMAISVASTRMSLAGLLTSWTEKPALIGLASGAFFGISAISYRGASLSLGDQGFLIRAAYTLACVTVFQTLVMALYMRLREPGQLTAVFRSWRVAAWAGITGMIASAGWFTAMTIQNAAYVRALGQIELVFTFAAAVFFFHERPNRTEVIGIGLVIAGLLLLVLH